MNIKSLLIGSAAALVAVSGARAADAVVMPEPEPVEYVRVCDMYGAGFFYIPGTETCLAISGYVWFQVGGVQGNNYFNNSVRARVNFDARSETEWGMLRGYVRLQGDWDPQNQIGSVFPVGVAPTLANRTGVFSYGGDGVVALDQAYIQLGGLMMGYSESFWADSKNGGVSNYGSHSWGGMAYGYQQRHLIGYRFEGGNGFSGAIALEDDGNANFVPDVVAKLAVNQGWGGVWVKVAYDEDLSNGLTGGARLPANLSGVDGWAAQLGAQINVPNAPGSSLRVIGFYSSNANAYSVGPNGAGGIFAAPASGSRWSVLASYNHQWSPIFGTSVAAQYFGDTNYGIAGNPSAWAVELSVVATPVTNFEIRAEINHTKRTANPGVTSGYLRFTRYF